MTEPELHAIVRDFHWMARRYADMRSSYAPGMFNGHTRKLIEAGIELNGPYFARDGMGRRFDRLTEEEVKAAADDMPRGFAPEPDDRLKDALAALRECQVLAGDGVELSERDGLECANFISIHRVAASALASKDAPENGSGPRETAGADA